MLLLTAIDQAYKTRPNAIHKDILIDQLMRGLEGDVAEMFGVDPPEYTYNASEPEDMELLLPAPYDDVYLWYLCAQIDLMNEETQLYQHDSAVYNAAWERAQSWYRRSERARRKKNWSVL